MKDNLGQVGFACEIHQPAGLPAVVRVTGEVDAATAPQVQEALVSAAGFGCGVDVDLSGVEFIDSTGLRALIIGRQAIDDDAQRLRITGSNSIVDRLLELTGLTEFLK